MYRVTARAYQTSYNELFLMSVLSLIVANLMFKNPMADARQINETKKTELSLMRWEKAIVYKNWIWISGFSGSM